MIFVENVTKTFSNGKGIFDVSFTVEEGDIFGFLGPNGAGKSTTIRQLMGFMKPDNGKLFISKYDCWKDTSTIQKFVGYLPGEIALIEKMKGNDFLNMLEEMKGFRGTSRKDALIDRFQFDPSVQIRKMSKGMKQKVGIVAAFMHDPSLYILDEPTSGLDPFMQKEFLDLLGEEQGRGKTILMSSHYFPEVERTCNRASIIKEGKIVRTDSMRDLRSLQTKKIEVAFKDEQEACAYADHYPDQVESRSGNRIVIPIKGTYEAFIASLQGRSVTNMEVETQTLEEVFMDIYDQNHTPSDLKGDEQ
ncbi:MULTISPECIES: ABC transporter ATP-binding protein [Pontibacillus]|uniref:ABC transporter ATP-binding protein n=1 Tax=Pontibacillus chungwhensis TaxID=265426 RepID=A0ABY8UV33_9BACI|nr:MULTISPECIES: ABC transporter ATP-binding protein [Pontibacillus]MCD5322898.1 ABC transporter ATP-binding protein [Pontibacillus sp. HN14]WIF96295.1 ABC transporter ATP-binding protein [Pontibacillus chungwhensis]